MELSDRELLAALTAGDRQAFVRIYHRHKIRLYSYCVRMLGGRDAATDVVQQVFVELVEKHQAIREPEKLAAWLLTVASHKCHRLLAERARLKAVETGVEQEFASDDHSCCRRIDTFLVRRAVAKLPPELREIIVLREYEDMPYREIAEILRLNEGTVKFRLHTARKRLCELVLAAIKVEERHELR